MIHFTHEESGEKATDIRACMRHLRHGTREHGSGCSADQPQHIGRLEFR